MEQPPVCVSLNLIKAATFNPIKLRIMTNILTVVALGGLSTSTGCGCCAPDLQEVTISNGAKTFLSIYAAEIGTPVMEDDGFYYPASLKDILVSPTENLKIKATTSRRVIIDQKRGATHPTEAAFWTDFGKNIAPLLAGKDYILYGVEDCFDIVILNP